MPDVGVRELKAHASEIIRKVREEQARLRAKERDTT